MPDTSIDWSRLSPAAPPIGIPAPPPAATSEAPASAAPTPPSGVDWSRLSPAQPPIRSTASPPEAQRGSDIPPDYNPWADAGVFGMQSLDPDASRHVFQGGEKAAVGAVALPGDVGAEVFNAGETAGRAAEQGLRPNPMAIDEFGTPHAFLDSDGKSAEPRPPDRVTTPKPSFMSSPYIMEKLKDTALDPNKLPVNNASDAIMEGAGGLLINLPLSLIGGEAAPALTMAQRAGRGSQLLPAIGRTLVSGAKGAAGGAVGGAIETPGDLGERAGAAVSGAAVGGALGLGLPPMVSTVNMAGRRLFGGKVDLPGAAGATSRLTAENAGQEYASNLGPDGVGAVMADADKVSTPGYAATVGQAAPGNKGALEMEQRARRGAPADAIVADRAQADSEIGAIRTQAGDGRPGAMTGQAANEQARIDAEGRAEVNAAVANRTAATNALPAGYVDKPIDTTPIWEHPDPTQPQVVGGQSPGPGYVDVNASQSPAHNTQITAAEQHGQQARAEILKTRQADHAERNSYRDQIDQDGNLVIPTDAIKDNTRERYSLGRYDQPTGGELAIRDDLLRLPDNAPLADLESLSRRVKLEIEALTPPGTTTFPDPARRLISVRQSIDRAIDDANPIKNPSVGDRVLKGDQRHMTMDEGVAHLQMRQKDSEIAQNYNTGAVGDTLHVASSGSNNFSSGAANLAPDVSRARGSFSLSDAEVMPRIWDKSLNEGANVAQYARTAGSMHNLKGWVAEDLRATAINPKTGDFDPAKYAQWRRDHRAGLNAMPPRLKASFDGVEAAQDAVQTAQAASAANKAAFETEAIKRLLNGETDRVVQQAFETGNPAKNLAEIRDKISGSQEAMDGFRKGVGEYIESRYQPMSPTGTTNPDRAKAQAFKKFLTDNEASFRWLYGNDGYDQFLAPIARQMADRAAASPAIRVKVPAANGNGNGHVGMDVAMAEGGIEFVKHVIPHGEKYLAAGLALRHLGARLLGRGITSRGQLINLGALDTNVGRALMQLQRPDAPVALLGRLSAAIGASSAQMRDAAAPNQPGEQHSENDSFQPYRVAGDDFLGPRSTAPKYLDSMPRGTYEDRRQAPLDLQHANQALQDRYSQSALGRIPVLGPLLRHTIEAASGPDDPRYEELLRSYQHSHPEPMSTQ